METLNKKSKNAVGPDRSRRNCGYKSSLPVAEFDPNLCKPEVKEILTEAIKNNKSLSDDGLILHTEPFQCCQLLNFLASDDFLQNLKDELLNLSFHQKDNDLYTFNQSDDLKDVKTPYIASLRTFFYGPFREWLEGVTGIKLETTVDMSCACYDYTDALLCHDDELEGRRLAYIFYLVPPWTANDGGALDLIGSDDNGEPDAVSKSICPQWNSCVFFKVSPKSYHQVAEVLTQDKSRLSISGWFYGEAEEWPSKPAQPPLPMTSPTDVDEEVFYNWLTPDYLDPETQMEIRLKFEEDSEVELTNFLNEDKYREVATALKDASLEWTSQGPLNRRNYDILQSEKLPQVVQECLNVLHSEAMFLTLSNLTGLRLHELAEQNSSSDDDDRSDGESCHEPQCKISKSDKTEINDKPAKVDSKSYSDVRQFKYASYTLLHDRDTEVLDHVLDSMLFLNCDGWEQEYGGYISYLEEGSDEELLRVSPNDNSLALVFRDKKTHRFVKRINHRAKTSGQFSKLQTIWSIYHE